MVQKSKKILFLGPVASGKDTQAFLLAKKFRLPVIAMGNLLREGAEKKTPFGQKISLFLASGKLVPDSLVLKIIRERIKKKDVRKGFILDGFPRDLAQVKALAKTTSLDFVFELKLSDKEVLRRATGRRICHCGATYHLKFNPPQKKNICDKCGRKLFIREDDKPEVVKKRLKIYHKFGRDLKNFYKRQKIYYPIDGSHSIKKIHQDIVGLIKTNF